jgi:outer membrane protein insertion porin family
MSLDHDDDLMNRLSSTSKYDDTTKTDSDKKLEKLLNDKQDLMIKQNKQYLEELFQQNNTRPVKIRNVQITNSQNFRDSYLLAQFGPLINSNEPITLAKLLNEIETISKSFIKLNVVENLLVSLQPVQSTYWGQSSSKTLTLVPVFNVVPVKKFYAKTGTNIGNGEGDGYIQFQLRNLFGGGENLTFDAVSGTKTSSSYLVNYNQPIFNNANFIIENSLYMNTRKFNWINSNVHLKGMTTKLYTQFDKSKSNINHDISLENCWKILDNQSSKSDDVLAQAGSNFKSSIIYNWTYDTRNNQHLPTAGKFLRLGFEYNGLTKYTKTPFVKTVFESQVSFPVKNHSVIISNKGGMLLPFSSTSYILDRFFIGGPNDVRSFTLNGLGPKNYNSSVGGDVFLNGGISLVSPIPFLKNNVESGFRIHNFVNFGKLVPMEGGIKSTISQLKCQYSVSYGIGILFNHPMARFELNFVLPLAVHDRDYTRKGLQYGIGVSFL